MRSIATATPTAPTTQAIGFAALFANTSGFRNTAIRFWNALEANHYRNSNTAVGSYALFGNGGFGGNGNTAIGFAALFDTPVAASTPPWA